MCRKTYQSSLMLLRLSQSSARCSGAESCQRLNTTSLLTGLVLTKVSSTNTADDSSILGPMTQTLAFPATKAPSLGRCADP
ncbi:hypothetical protein FHG87_007244 [Trinorchestia longiramus]|nr:hypothetical protein FHG87_007244 [Trinorchestia longiramus]